VRPAENDLANVGKPAREAYQQLPTSPPHFTVRPGRSKRRHPFEQLLQRRRPRRSFSPSATDLSDEATNMGRADVASLNRWFRPESPVENPPSLTPRPPLKIPPHHKVLVSVGADTSQARIHITAGKLAGTQIQLTASGSRVQTQLLTANLATRQTLVVAMTAVRERLRARGARRVGSKGGTERSSGTGWNGGAE